MPAKFDRVAAQKGAKIRTVVPKKGVYIHVAIPPGGGPSVAGEVHHKIKKKRAWEK